MLSLRKTRLQELLEEDRGAAQAVRALRAQPERFLATVQIGMTVISATAGAFGGASVAGRLRPVLERAGLAAPLAEDLALAVVVALISYLSLVIGELVPKSLALRYAEGYALTIAPTLRILAALMRPLVWFLTASSNLVLRAFGDRTTFTEARLSRDELQQLVEEATKTGAIDPQAGEIASRVFDFEELAVEAVMVPSPRVVALRKGASLEEVGAVIQARGHSRLPVYEGTPDQVVGYVLAKDVLAHAWQHPTAPWDPTIREPFFVAETMRAVTVLKELQRRRTHLAVVVDEHGALAGIVTVEDLLEELVGEIFSEHEQPAPIVQPDQGGAHLVQGTAPVREVNRALGLELNDVEGAATIAALCITLAGTIPAAGTRLTAQDGTVLEVVEASPRRVRLVRLHRPAPPPAP